MARKPAPPSGDRRQQILEAALDLFAEQGLEGATSKDIAERAEVTHGLIYFYFKSKEELFKSAFEYALQQSLAQLDIDGALESDEPPEQALTHLLTRLKETLTSPHMVTVLRLMMHTTARHDWRDGPLHDCKLQMGTTVRIVVSSVRDYLDRQVALGRIRPVNTEIVAQFLVGGAATAMRWAKTGGTAQNLPADTAAVISDTFMRGLLAAPVSPVSPAKPIKPMKAIKTLKTARANASASEVGAVALGLTQE